MSSCPESSQIFGTVFNTQRFTIHDGPGLRTEFFLKGCPLQCPWCGNPESQKLPIQLGVYRKKCIGLKKCGACVELNPPEGALSFYRGRLVSIDNSKISNPLDYADACPSEAIKQWGERMSVEDCMKIVRRDKGYYEKSGGGVTVSGGDPLVQCDFVAELFKACQSEDIHTCFESDFFGNWAAVEKVHRHTDLFIADIKQMDDEIHKAHTKVSNETILENLKKLSQLGKPIILRIPIIPKFNDSMDNVKATADFILNEMGGRVETLQLLSYMRLGEEKYESLNLEYPMRGLRFNRKAFQARVQSYADYFNSQGIHCLVGTKEQ